MISLSLSEEQDLLRKLQQGDKKAFELIYRTYHYRLIGHLIRLLKSKDLAQEVVQETFIALWDSRDMLHVDNSILPYLYRIASNKTINIFKKAMHDQRYREYLYPLIEQGYEQIEQNLYHKEQREILQKIIEKMPERQREIFVLCKFEGKTYEEVANELQLSIHTVHTQIKRANQLIKENLVNYPEFILSIVATISATAMMN